MRMIFSPFKDKSAITFVEVSTSLPPGVEGEVKCHLRVAISKILWLINKPLGTTNVLLKWWGEKAEGTIFRPVDGKRLLFNSEYTANVGRFPIKCRLKELAAYLHDMGVLILHVLNNDSYLGSVSISNLHYLIEGKPINGFFPVVTSSEEKIADVHVSLVLEDLLDQPEDFQSKSSIDLIMNTAPLTGILKESKGSKNLGMTKLNNKKSATSEKKVHFPFASSSATPPSKKRTFTRVHQKPQIPKLKIGEGALPLKPNPSVTRAVNSDKSCTACKSDKSERRDGVQDLSDVARTDTTSILQYMMEEESSNSLNVEETAVNLILGQDLSPDEMAIATHLHTIDSAESTDEDSGASISSDPVHDESLLQQLFYSEDSKENEKPISHNHIKEMKSKTIAGQENKNTESTKNITLADQIRDKLGRSKIEVLSKVKFARVYIDSLRTEKESHFFQEKEDKKNFSSSLYMVEYGFPTNSPGKDKGFGSISSIETIRISSKKINNYGVYFGHRSVFPVTFSFAALVRWWKSAIPFKVYIKHPDESMSTLLGTTKLPLRSVLESDNLSFNQQLNLQCPVRSGNEGTSSINENNLILKVKIELASDVRGFYSLLANLKSKNTSLSWQSSSSIPDDSLPLSKDKSPAVNAKSLGKISMTKKDVHSFDKDDSQVTQLTQQYEPSFSYLQDNLPVQAYLNVSHGTGFLPPGLLSSGPHSQGGRSSDRSNVNWTTRNLYLECRMFGKEDNCQSLICWSTLHPVFHYAQAIPLFLNPSFLERTWNNYMVIEVWDKIPTAGKDELVGICKIPLHQFYLAFKDKAMVAVLLQAKYPVIGVDCYLTVNNVFTSQPVGQLHVLLAIGTSQQIFNLQKSRQNMRLSENEISSFNSSPKDQSQDPTSEADELTIKKAQYSQTSFVSNSTTFTQTSPRKKNKETQFEIVPHKESLADHSKVLQQHIFEIEIKNIQGLLLDKMTMLEDSECFVQYYFLTESKEGNFVLHSNQSISSQFGPNPVFNEKYIHIFHLDKAVPITEKLQEACGPLLPFFLWRRKYQPNFSESVIARANLPVARVCSLVTLWNQKQSNKISLSLPLLHSNSSDKVDNLGLLNLTLSYSCSLVKGLGSPLITHEAESFSDKIGEKDDGEILEVKDMDSEIAELKTTFLAQIIIEQMKINSSNSTEESTTEYTQNIYITIPAGSVKASPKSPKIRYSDKSELNWCAEVRLPTEMLINNRKPLLLKVWSSCDFPGGSTEQLLGFCVVDLLTLPLGLDRIYGWYNIIDFNGKCQGQLKISIKPLEDVSHFKKKLLSFDSEPSSLKSRFITVGEYPLFPSHISQHWEQSIQLKQKDFPHDFDENLRKSQEDLREILNEDKETTARIRSEEINSRNFENLIFNRNVEDSSSDLKQNLKKHLKDLEDLNFKLKEKLMFSKRLLSNVSQNISTPDKNGIPVEIPRDMYAGGEPQPESLHRNKLSSLTSKHTGHRTSEYRFNELKDADVISQDKFSQHVVNSHNSRHITSGDNFITATCITSSQNTDNYCKGNQNSHQTLKESPNNPHHHHHYHHNAKYSEPVYYSREGHVSSPPNVPNKNDYSRDVRRFKEINSESIHLTDSTSKCIETEQVIPLFNSVDKIISNQNSLQNHKTEQSNLTQRDKVSKHGRIPSENTITQISDSSNISSFPVNTVQYESLPSKSVGRKPSSGSNSLHVSAPTTEEIQEINTRTFGLIDADSQLMNEVKEKSSGNVNHITTSVRAVNSQPVRTSSGESSRKDFLSETPSLLGTSKEIPSIAFVNKVVADNDINNIHNSNKSATNKSAKKVRFSVNDIENNNELASSELLNINTVKKNGKDEGSQMTQEVNGTNVKFLYESFKTSSPLLENVDFSSQSKEISPIYPASDISISNSSGKSYSDESVNKNNQSEARIEVERHFSSSTSQHSKSKVAKVGSGRLAAAIFSKPKED